jgi:hypothetical protein
MTEDGSSEGQPDADAVGTDFDTGEHHVRFTVWTNYGVGVPHYYVCLSVGTNDEHNWWFDPDQAEALGRKLQEFGALTRRQNIDEEERLRQIGFERGNEPDP